LALVLAALLAPLAAAALEAEPLSLVTETGEHKFTVEIADQPDNRAKGLMFRRSLGDDAGMLFVYETPQRISMWMRNTYIPLDMVFITADGRVHRVERGTEPFSEEVIDSGEPVLAVLEVKAGTADRLKLKPGDKVLHRAFKP